MNDKTQASPRIVCGRCDRAACMTATVASPSLDEDTETETVVLCPVHAVEWMVGTLKHVAEVEVDA